MGRLTNRARENSDPDLSLCQCPHVSRIRLSVGCRAGSATSAHKSPGKKASARRCFLRPASRGVRLRRLSPFLSMGRRFRLSTPPTTAFKIDRFLARRNMSFRISVRDDLIRLEITLYLSARKKMENVKMISD